MENALGIIVEFSSLSLVKIPVRLPAALDSNGLASMPIIILL